MSAARGWVARVLLLLGSCLYLALTACSGGGGAVTSSTGATPAAGSGENVATVVVDGGPAEAADILNALYVDVTVCEPGSTLCRTVDHVLVDTGSAGLRLVGSALDDDLALPAVSNAAGRPVGECTQFATGYTWGSVRLADVRIAGKTARSLPVQVIADPAFGAAAPADCRNFGNSWGSVAALGAKGILGIGLFVQNCGESCARNAIAGTYYGCTGNDCVPTALALERQVANPVAFFDGDNNGVVLSLPAVPSGGVASLRGTLTFGIGTRDNNALGSARAYAANAYGFFTTTYKGRSLTASFIDSGSNALFFPDATLAECRLSPGFFCPARPLTLQAVNTGAGNGVSEAVSVVIESLDTLAISVQAASVGADIAALGENNSFDWGLPFFFGRRVFVAIEGRSTPAGAGPYWAY